MLYEINSDCKKQECYTKREKQENPIPMHVKDKSSCERKIGYGATKGKRHETKARWEKENGRKKNRQYEGKTVNQKAKVSASKKRHETKAFFVKLKTA